MSPASGLRTRIGIIATASAFGLTYGLSAPLIALELDDRGVSGTLIGLNAAMHAIGVLLVAPRLPGIVARAGLGKPAATALVASALVLSAFPFAPFIWLWFVLRVLLGMASESLFVISESWLSETSEADTRSRTMGIYVAAMSAGIALGPAILSVVGRQGPAAFLIGSALAICALVILLSTRPREVRIEQHGNVNLGTYLRLAPIAIGAAALNAAIEAAGLALLPLYAISLGWDEKAGTMLLTVLLIGAILLQLPVGWLGDRMERNHLIRWLALISGIGALAWPMALSHPWLAWPLIFIWGGVFVGIYTTVLTAMGERFHGAQLTGVFGAMSVAWGVGALMGPLLVGAASHVWRHGLPFMVAGLCFSFLLACQFLDDSHDRNRFLTKDASHH